MLRIAAVALSAFLFLSLNGLDSAIAAPAYVGPEKCQNCHKAPYEVWKGTKHFSSYKKIHKHKPAKKILKAVGEKRMKKAAVCATCHYTAIEKKGKPKPVAGTSCESCHGPASEWISIHNNKKVDKATRVKQSVEAGMVRPDNLYDIASNCMSCHGLENSKLSGKHASAMLANGHPLNPNFEMVEYSQGSVRHRFYPPDVTTNKKMTKPELSRLYVIGQAAALVSANRAISKTNDSKFVTAQKVRIDKAKTVLAKIPDAAKFLSNPSREGGQALADAIKTKDLSSLVGDQLPTSYK